MLTNIDPTDTEHVSYLSQATIVLISRLGFNVDY